MHHEWTLKAVDAGKHVLVEKPYSRRAARRGGLGRRREAGVVVMEAFMWRHHPQAAKARIVESGSIGRLREIRTTFSFMLTDLGNVRMAPDLDGGALMDVGCCCVSGAPARR